MDIPYGKIKSLLVELTGQLWDDEWQEVKRIVEAAPQDERIIQVAFNHTIDCTGELPCIKTKISFSEKFTATATASVDDPDQADLPLGDPPRTVDEIVGNRETLDNPPEEAA